MKKGIAIALMLGLVMTCGAALAYQPKVWDDLSWWGNSGATPAPVADRGMWGQGPARAGYWWWPKAPASNSDDSELWGNRGVVYNNSWQKPEQKKPQKVSPPGQAKPAKEEITIPVLNNILFDFDKAVLKPEGKKIADQVVELMKKWPQITALIEGHTCNMGPAAYNMALGQRRADAVKKYLVQCGIDPSRITTKSYGETKPAVPNDTIAHRRLNRRAVFVLSK